ncbi:hypothetical protein [Thiosocius teredinicola]|uniref:hypothetical protein n=1 Tax=Thiosocius teredinicola TaxID=1973002 RepID=UPI0009911FF0
MRFWDLLQNPDKKRDKVAIEIDVAADVLEECPVCRGISDKGRDDRLPVADLLAHQRFDSNDPSIAIFHGDRNDLLQRLRTVRRKFNYHCTCQEAG